MLGLGLAVLGTAPVFAQTSPEVEAIRAQIEALRAEQSRIIEQQRQTEATLRSLEQTLDAMGPTKYPRSAPAAAARTPAGGTPDTHLQPESPLEISGDFRLRSQADVSDQGSKDRYSAQVRGRLLATYAVNERVSVGARMVTGDADDPKSDDVQLSNFADDFQVSLAQAYVQLNLGDLKLYGGKIPQPFARTDLVWDSDVNPQGISAVYKRLLANGGALRANGLGFIIDEQAVASDSTMLGAQIGYDSPALGNWKYDVSAAYYDYQIGSALGANAVDFRTNLRRPDGRYLSDFDLGDLIVGATWSGLSKRWPLRIVGDYVHNFGAETTADTGYGMDFALGRASQPGDWRFTYGYSAAESDAVLAAFSHNNIGIATNYRLHSLAVDYVPAPKTVLGAIWYHYKPDAAIHAGANDPDDWLDRVRLYYLVNF